MNKECKDLSIKQWEEPKGKTFIIEGFFNACLSANDLDAIKVANFIVSEHFPAYKIVVYQDHIHFNIQMCNGVVQGTKHYTPKPQCLGMSALLAIRELTQMCLPK